MPANRRRTATAGAKILKSLDEIHDALEEGAKLEERFTVRTVQLDLTPRAYGPADVKLARRSLGLSQSLFARFLGVDLNTVRSWEQGINPPSPIACRFMDEIILAPEHWKERLRQLVKRKDAPAGRAQASDGG